jgi:hypothetical protein
MPIDNTKTNASPATNEHPAHHNALADGVNSHETRVAALEAAVPAHTSNTGNPHSVTKAQVGLGSVDNTADTAKPVSTAQATADTATRVAAVAAAAAANGARITRRPEDFGAMRDNMTDDSAAIRAALASAVAACQADGSYYCEVQFSSGTYLAPNATIKGGATKGNAQIPLPAIDPTTGQKVTIVLRGLADAGAWNHWLQTVPQRSGAVIRSTLTGQTADATWHSPSVIGGPTVEVTGASEFSNIRVVIDGLTVMCPPNPSMIAMDLRRAAQADPRNYSALANGIPSEIIAPTDQGGIGLYMPTINNNDSCNIGNYECQGFYYPIGFSDHLCAQRLALIYCNTAMFINSPPGTYVHGSTIMMLSVESYSTIIETNLGGQYPLWIGSIHAETGSGLAEFKDPSNGLRGYIGFANNQGGADPTVNGCANIKIENLNRTRGAITAPSLPASGVASTPIFRDAAVAVSGGTVTQIRVDGVVQGITSGMVYVPCGKTMSITYSVAPTWVWTLI